MEPKFDEERKREQREIEQAREQEVIDQVIESEHHKGQKEWEGSRGTGESQEADRAVQTWQPLAGPVSPDNVTSD